MRTERDRLVVIVLSVVEDPDSFHATVSGSLYLKSYTSLECPRRIAAHCFGKSFEISDRYHVTHYALKFAIPIVSAILACSGSLRAQKIESAPPEVTEPSVQPKRLTNELPSRATPTPTPAPSPTPTGTPAVTSLVIQPPAERDPRTPEEVVGDFFSALQKDNVDVAYESLSAGSMLATKGEESLELRATTQGAIDAYGPIKGFELVKTDRVGALLERRTYVLHGEVMPLRWRFYFYKGSGDWKLVDLRVDDALIELFDEVGVPENK